MKGKSGSFIRDLLLFAISTFVPKAISFFLVPLYTNSLTTAEYGVVDMITTTASLMIPIMTLNISDAVLRFTIENKEDKKPFKVAYKFMSIGFLIVSIFITLNIIFKIYSISVEYQIFLVLQFIFTAMYSVNISYLRATERVGLLVIASIVNTIITLSLNILTLVVLKMGITGYLLSNLVGIIVVNIMIFVRIKLWEFADKKIIASKTLGMEMIKYSGPLVASNIAWWINSTSDRYILTYYKGIEENGIYSVAYKIPTILQLFQSVFSQAWLLSIYREYNKEDGKYYVGKVYDLYNGMMSIVCAVLILVDIPLARFLYAKDFYFAWKYVPFLLLSIVFIANAGFFETILTLFKKSKIVARTTIIGAVVNTLLNFTLIYYWGAMGAAIATVCGYFVMWILRIHPVKKEYSFVVNWSKQILILLMLLAETIAMSFFENYKICFVIVIAMFIAEYKTIIYFLKNIINKIIIRFKT